MEGEFNNMIKLFQDYLNSFYIAISGAWCMSQGEIKEGLLKGLTNNAVETSLPNKPAIKVDMYKLSLELPTAPFKNDFFVNNYIKIQARLLIIACYESLKEDKKWDKIKKIPLIEVFRHIRNAAAHNNHFIIKSSKGLPLKWENKIINLKTHGEELFFKWISLSRTN